MAQNGDPAWIERLRNEIRDARRLLARFSDIGTIEARSGTWVLRRFVLSDAPYVIWFARDTSVSNADIWLTRLFHAHQRRPRPSARLPGTRRPPRS